ncbi:MAG: precorrin-8X methylmutase [Mogibacterium sp.]|nr:precorrin-8X methylmutase [Mogibacterium sp.]
MIEYMLPGDIETKSLEIIKEELLARGISLPAENDAVIRRAIHASADFDYARTLCFSEGAVSAARELIKNGASIVTDTNMALTGINKKRLASYGGTVRCYMADEDVAEEAKARGITRASVSMERAARNAAAGGIKTIFAIGNAPTALVTLRDLYDRGIYRPDFIIGVPVGFVNVAEAKELILDTDIPHIVNRGRKGGSNVAAAIVNAILYGMD